jgi:DNA methylase
MTARRSSGPASRRRTRHRAFTPPPGDWFLDPFCGFGTTLVAAERLGRHAAGCEVDECRAAFTAARLGNPDRVVHGRCEDLAPGQWPPFTLVLTSPPYGSFRSGDHYDDPATYLADARHLFSGFARLLAPGATVAVEVSQLRQGNRTRPLVWRLGSLRNGIFPLREDLVRVNTGNTQAGRDTTTLTSWSSTFRSPCRTPDRPCAHLESVAAIQRPVRRNSRLAQDFWIGALVPLYCQ